MRAEGAVQSVRLVEATSGEFLSVRSLSVEAAVDGPMSRTDLRITFANELGRTIEGDLVFPLPPFAALCELTVRVGNRTLQGKFRPRERAQAEYHRAVQAGKTAALGESEGEDLGRLRVAPIESGEDVEVSLSLLHTLLPITDGHRLIIPLTYMPRYVEDEQGLKATEKAAVDRPRPLTAAARAEVKISVRKGDAPLAVRCKSHAVKTHDAGRMLEVEVAGVPLDRDLQVEILDRQKGDLPTVWVRHDPGKGRDGQGPSTAVALLPPPFADEGATVARTILLLVDRSGSMDGDPMRSAIRAVKGCLRALGPADRFNIIAFNNTIHPLARRPLPFDDQSLQAADAFAQALTADGGTEASNALQAVLDDDVGKNASARLPGPAVDSSHRLRIVVFMTDGDVGSAEHVLARAQDRLIDTRLFVIGIGASVNHAMLAKLAELGSGTYTPVSSNEDLERALHKLKNAIDAPILTGVKVRLQGGGDKKEPGKLEPAGRLDLFAGQPLVMAFRGALAEDAMLHVTAQRSDGEDVKISVPVQADPNAPPIDAETAGLTWALLKNRRLTYKFDPNDDATLEDLGTTFGLVNRRVALVGIHQEQRHTDSPETVPVVLPLPANLASGVQGEASAPPMLTKTGSLPMSPPMSMARPDPVRAQASPVTLGPPPAAAAPGMANSVWTRGLQARSADVDVDVDDGMMASASLSAPMPYPAAPSAITGQPPPELDAMEMEEAAPPAEKAKKGGSVLGRIAKALGLDSDKDAGPPPAPPPPSPKKVAARPVPASAPRAAAMPAVPGTQSIAASGAPGSAPPRFTDDEAGLRALLLQQGAEGLFDGDVGTTLVAVAALVGRGHTARSGSFRAELRRTVQALKSRIGALTGAERSLVALGLAMLRIGSGEELPSELPVELGAILGGASLSDVPALRSALRSALDKAPAWKRSSIAQAIEDAFLKP